MEIGGNRRFVCQKAKQTDGSQWRRSRSSWPLTAFVRFATPTIILNEMNRSEGGLTKWIRKKMTMRSSNWPTRNWMRFSPHSCTKTGSTQPKLSAACFVVQSCLADADFVVFSDYCLIGTRHIRLIFLRPQGIIPLMITRVSISSHSRIHRIRYCLRSSRG